MVSLREIVVSVPHSGTRTLQQHLGLDHYEHLYSNRKDLLNVKDFIGHVPVRHPMDVATSWACRNANGHELNKLLDSYGMMFRYIEAQAHELHKIEDIPIVVGNMGLRPSDHIDRVLEFQHAVDESVVIPHSEFFSRMYGSQE